MIEAYRFWQTRGPLPSRVITLHMVYEPSAAFLIALFPPQFVAHRRHRHTTSGLGALGRGAIRRCPGCCYGQCLQPLWYPIAVALTNALIGGAPIAGYRERR
jgi:hypothetical protein